MRIVAITGAWRSAASASARSRPIVDFELPLELQPKFLRVLQEQEFVRVGGTRTIKIDVRLVAATNRDLVQMVDEHRFRDDLYYRLNVFPIYAPPLRERAEDIEPLVRHFAQHFAARMQRRIEAIPTETLDALRRYTWPGNVRELENLIERAVILSAGPRLTVPLEHLGPSVYPAGAGRQRVDARASQAGPRDTRPGGDELDRRWPPGRCRAPRNEADDASVVYEAARDRAARLICGGRTRAEARCQTCDWWFNVTSAAWP